MLYSLQNVEFLFELILSIFELSVNSLMSWRCLSLSLRCALERCEEMKGGFLFSFSIFRVISFYSSVPFLTQHIVRIVIFLVDCKSYVIWQISPSAPLRMVAPRIYGSRNWAARLMLRDGFQKSLTNSFMSNPQTYKSPQWSAKFLQKSLEQE